MKEYYLRFQEWFNGLAARERKMLMAGSAATLIFILYQFIFSPTLNSVASLRKKITTDQKTLVWMTEADKQLQGLQKQPSKTRTKPIVFLGILQKEIASSGLEQYLSNLKQGNNDSIEIHFQNIEFDKLMSLLITILKQYPVAISQMNVTSTPSSGIVNVDLIISMA